jgi:two-component system chemotaxis response regulator CheY
MRTGIIVDDATIMRLRLREILEKEFKIVAEAVNGREALELYEKHRPDFVTLDITMPQVNGLEALTAILARYPEARVVIVSAVGQKQVVFQALGLGAKDFVIKPFEPDRVIKAINRLFC